MLLLPAYLQSRTHWSRTETNLHHSMKLLC